MITYLPYADFDKCAQAMSNTRLASQRLDVLEILYALTGRPNATSCTKLSAWKRHPCTIMWRGHELALSRYGLACCDEWTKRVYVDNVVRGKILSTMAQAFGNMIGAKGGLFSALTDLPWFIGDERLHSSMRAAMLWKAHHDFTDRVMTVRDWAHDKRAQDACDEIKQYKQREGWTEEPRMQIWWPVRDQATKRADHQPALGQILDVKV